MSCKNPFVIVLTIICLCSSSNYVSSNDNVIGDITSIAENSTLNNISLISEHRNLLSETNNSNSDSEIMLHPSNNVFKLLNDKYMTLPVQQNNINVNNELNILDNKFNENNNDNIENDSEHAQQNNEAVALNIQEAKVNDGKKESFCKHLTTMTYGIVLLPMAIYGGIISNIRLGTNRITQDINNKLTEIRSETKEFVGIVCNDTMSAFGGCVTVLCSKVADISTKIYSVELKHM